MLLDQERALGLDPGTDTMSLCRETLIVRLLLFSASRSEVATATAMVLESPLKLSTRLSALASSLTLHTTS